MIDYLANLATNSMFWLSIIAIFCAVAIIAWLLVRRANLFMDDYQSVFKETATGNLEDMFLFIDPQQLFIANIVALVLAPLLAYMMTGDFSIALIVFVLLIVIPMWAYKKMRQNRLKKFEKQLPDVLVMISGALASGLSLIHI